MAAARPLHWITGSLIAAATALALPVIASATEAAAPAAPCGIIRSPDGPTHGLPRALHWNNCEGHHVKLKVRAVFRIAEVCVRPGITNLGDTFQGREEPVYASEIGTC